MLDDMLRNELNNIDYQKTHLRTAGSWIMEQYVTIYDDDARRGVILLGKENSSYKLGNICFDLKKAALATTEYIASINMPDSKIKAFQFLIITAFWICKSAKEDINDLAAEILLYMHERNLYKILVLEENLISDFQRYYEKKSGKILSKQEIMNEITLLEECKCIEIEEGKLLLCEKVWGKR